VTGSEPEGDGGKVFPFAPKDGPLPGSMAAGSHRADVPRERFEHVLDDDPDEPQAVHPPGGFPLPPVAPGRAPVRPAFLRSREGLRAEAARQCERLRYEAEFHAIRLPWYAAKTMFWAAWGALVLANRLRQWWWVSEATGARLQAVADNDGREYRVHHAHQRKVRGERGTVIVICAGGTVLAAVLVTVLFPLAWAAILPVLAVLAARAGRPAGRPIITPSMTEPVVRVISEDTLVRAYARAGLCKPGVPGEGLGLGVMSRDRGGTAADVYLPHGGTFAAAVNARAKIASGLDVKASQVYLTESPVSERRHRIWIADEDPLAIPAGRTPLLRLRPVNVWRDLFEMGLDHYGRKVRFCLLWISILIGAQPRKGKTFTARLLALFCALDPFVRITIADGKAAPDWRMFRLVAHRTIFGTRPGRDGDPVEKLRDELRDIERHIEEVNNFLSDLPVDECPEGKLTEALCRKYPRELFLWLLVLEEVYFYVETDDQEVNKDIAQRMSNIRSAGPSAGVIVLTSLQKPAGVGSGDVARLWNRFRDNHDARFALKCGNRNVSEAVLGGDAYSEGWDASALPDGKRYKGVGILYQVPDLDETLTVRSYLADGEDAEKILVAARRFREQAGTLSGEAAGEGPGIMPRDVLADILSVFRGEPALHWTELAERLAGSIPERWADVSPAALTAQCRDLGVQSVPVTRARESSRGCRREHVERAARGDYAAAQ
jgi:DNA segregation ATPase FtsK/SpoIIIE, S-DNA-T family